MAGSLRITSATTLTVVYDGTVCKLAGDWNVQKLSVRGEVVARRKALTQVKNGARWDLSAISTLDAVGAQLLWQAWGQRMPADMVVTSGQQALLDVLAQHPIEAAPAPQAVSWLGWLRAMGNGVFL
ncbi:MAG: ABC transporter permease, partial [Zwartia sp.]